ncbi:TetR/AcrR family transcriptional regulator [Corynebacterium halotolerans]|uniref:TetR family transcriptional regulator n=1 Tax=Corynebacterium halotolerans YIM 70093 = DSM 44683 TaxID=1121362 RepID=M1NKU4_9CORY|nr:TetR/AcrR family transcriptional regulator [Corynebacterium halotolerans]AGF71998.1 TetR family transcriptional regulator [Corynebacterium halotolerans YIM 70093 = DSM 44683]
MTATPQPRPRPRRQRLGVEERRAVILAAAREHFADTPYPKASTAAIAEASGSSTALVFHYFGSKAGLYAAVVADALDRLAAAQQAAGDALPAGVPVRDRVRALLLVHLDHLAAGRTVTATRAEPAEALAVRRKARGEFIGRLRALLRVSGWTRHEYALWGYVGFLDQACGHWVEAGCPEDGRHPLVDAALGALEGALGDWRG